jgi:dipeptide/tripeptide permease
MNAEMEDYRREAQKAKVRVSGPLLVAGIAFLLFTSLHLTVPWWAVLALLGAALGGGIIYPVVYRRRHHPNRADRQERRYTLVQLVGRTLGFIGIVAGLLALNLGTETATAIAPYLGIIGVIFASASIFFRYKGWDE